MVEWISGRIRYLWAWAWAGWNSRWNNSRDGTKWNLQLQQVLRPQRARVLVRVRVLASSLVQLSPRLVQPRRSLSLESRCLCRSSNISSSNNPDLDLDLDQLEPRR